MSSWTLALRVTVCLMLIVATNAHSQENLHFTVDRPGISDYPTLVPKGFLQIETGFEYFKRENEQSFFLPTMLLRSSVSSWLELRLTNRYILVDSTGSTKERNNYYYGALEAKVKLIKEKGVIPATALLAGYSITPRTSHELRGPIWGNHLLLLLENNLHDKVLFNYNFGWIWNGYSGTQSALLSFAFEIELSTQHAVFVEHGTFLNEGEENDYWFDLGYTHLAAKHSQFDISFGLNLNHRSPDYFVQIGYSTRLGY